MPLVRLKIRPQFLKIAAKGRKYVCPTLVMQAMKFGELDQARAKSLARQTYVYHAAFLGFTASKKVGNAVARNRAKRRLTHLATDVLSKSGHAGWAYVVIARAASVSAAHTTLEQDMIAAVEGLHKPKGQGKNK